MAARPKNECTQVSTSLVYNSQDYQPFVRVIKEVFYIQMKDLIAVIAFGKNERCAQLVVDFWQPPFSSSQRLAAMHAAQIAHRAFVNCIIILPKCKETADDKQERELGPVSILSERLNRRKTLINQQRNERALHMINYYQGEEVGCIFSIVEQLESDDFEQRMHTSWQLFLDNKSGKCEKMRQDLLILQEIYQLFSTHKFSYAFSDEYDCARATNVQARLLTFCINLKAALAEEELTI